MAGANRSTDAKIDERNLDTQASKRDEEACCGRRMDAKSTVLVGCEGVSRL